MLNAGLTGGIASGKSTVSRLLEERGAHILDFDRLAHEAEEPGAPAWQGIVDHFGETVLTGGRIDRKKLGAIVFNNHAELLALNSIVHPVVEAFWRARVDQITARDERAIVISDVPLLFETGWDRKVNFVILVYISPAEQVRRLMARNGLSREEAQLRLKSQIPIEEKVSRADFVFNNEGPLEKAGQQFEKLWKRLLEEEQLHYHTF